MFYSDSQARTLIIEAGLRLVKEKLIARTWGNVSARISETEFIITPSGLGYELLKPEDLVVVNINDLSWNGERKPSSEKGIHASVYKLRPEVSFVIHTHQMYASAISVTGEDTAFAPCCGYGLSGTKSLKNKTEKKIRENPKAYSFLMRAHGVLCLGSDYEDAFNLAKNLEENSKALFDKVTADREKKKDLHPYLDDYAQIMGFTGRVPEKEEKQTIELITQKNDAAGLYCNYKKRLNFWDVTLQHIVYTKKYSKMRGVR